MINQLDKPSRPFLWIAIAFFLPTLTWAEPIRIGDIGTHPSDQIKRFAAFANYLAQALKPEGIDQGRIVVVKSIPEMANLMREGKVDLLIDSSYPVLAVSRLSGSKFLLRRWKKGQADYHGVIFARKDSNISQLEDLKGKIIAFEEPFSTMTYLLPKMVMVQRGLKMAAKTGSSDPIGAQEVGYIFVGDDPNAMFWVLERKAAAGVMNNQNYQIYAKGHLDTLKIIHETFSIPRQIVSHRADLNPKLVARIKEVLLKMDQSEQGRRVLRDFEETAKFDPISDEAMASLLKLQKFIDTEIGIK